MNTKATILHVRPSQVVERSVIETVLKVYPDVLGFALQHEGQLVHESFTEMPPVEDILNVVENAKDGHRVFFFGQMTKPAEGELDIQNVPPFIMANSEGAPSLAMFAEGPFSKYKSNDGYTPAFNMMNEVVFAAIEKAADTDGDIDKTLKALQHEDFKKTLINTITDDHGWFMFLPYKGDPWMFGKNTDMIGFKWGTISNKIGLEALIPPPAVEPPPKKVGISFLQKKTVGPVKDPAPVLPVESASPADTIPATDTKINFVQIKVPERLQGGVKNAWIRLFNGDRAKGLGVAGDGELPANHQAKNLTIPVHPSLVPFTKIEVSDTKGMKRLQEMVLKGEQPKENAEGPKTSVPTSSPPAATTTTTATNGGKSTVREPASSYVSPALTVEEADKAMAKFIGYLDSASKVRPTPLEIQKAESKWPVFSEKLGINFNDMLFRSVNELYDLFDKNGIATAAFIEMRRKYIETNKIDLAALLAETKGDEPTVANTAGAPVQSTPEPEIVVKKSAFSFMQKKKAAA